MWRLGKARGQGWHTREPIKGETGYLTFDGFCALQRIANTDGPKLRNTPR